MESANSFWSFSVDPVFIFLFFVQYISLFLSLNDHISKGFGHERLFFLNGHNYMQNSGKSILKIGS